MGKGKGAIDLVPPYIKTSYQDVERTCGVKFGNNFINGLLKQGTIIINLLPPEIAICIFKELSPDKVSSSKKVCKL